MTEKTMGEIYLEPEEEKIKNAAEIAAKSKDSEKFIFTLFYSPSDKGLILSELKRIGAVIVNYEDKDSAVTVKMNMAQLAAIKTLDCVERVEMIESVKQLKNISTKGEINDIINTQQNDVDNDKLSVPKATSDSNEGSLLSYDEVRSTVSGYSNYISTAIHLPLSTWKSGSLCGPCDEIWYRFTASVSNASQYTIYTTGSMDTVGYLYDANGSYITHNDDNGGLNFSITRALTYGATYYICVKAYGSNAGSFNIRVNYTTSSSGNGGHNGCSNAINNAIALPLSTYVSGNIDCPCAEKWYRFTASNRNAAQYKIYTSGSLDTVGYLYDANGNILNSDDDSGVDLNFNITRALTYGATYYVCVRAFGRNTGSYNIRIDTVTSGGQSGNNCSNQQATAIQLTVNTWQSGEIRCPGAEIWYKFTPNATGYYTIYTVGSLDTVGQICDSSIMIDEDDDSGTRLNFKMVPYLIAGHTYYIRVVAHGGNTGQFSIAVISTVFVEYVTIDHSYVALNKGETVKLNATPSPSYATNQTLYWHTGDASVATVDQNGLVTATGAGKTCICAFSQDGSNKSSCCEVSVNVPVQSVIINTTSLLMRVGENDRLFAQVCPFDAVNQLVRWSSSNTNVVWVNEVTGEIEARGVGSATIYATAQDGTGVKSSCTIQVEPPIPVQGIDICCDTYTMNVGETKCLSYDIYPSDATNKSVTWCSSNPNVAEVDASNGMVTSKKVGKTIITVTTNDGSFVASCELSVKERVIISKDGNYSNVRFNDGKVWKCNMYVYDNVLESNQPVDNQRSIHNNSINFSERQLGFLFRIDPNGVIYYVMNKRLSDDASPTDYLIYRDNIFKEIYGVAPKFFTYENSQLYYYTGINYDNRYSVYSEAELIFGMLPRWTLQNVAETLIGAALSIISIYVPAIGVAMLTCDVITAFFFTGAFGGAMNSVAEEFITDSIKTDYGPKMARRFGWAITIVNLIPSLLKSALPPDMDDEQIAVYENAYIDQSYIINNWDK